MLQGLLGALMQGNMPTHLDNAQEQHTGGAAAAAAAQSASGSSSSRTGFHVTRLPGNGFTATYSSSSGPSSLHMSAGAAHSSGGGFTGQGFVDASAGPHLPMFSGPEDFMFHLLSGHTDHAHQQHSAAAGSPGFTHYNPSDHSSHFEPMMASPGAGLEAILSQLMGSGLFGGGGGGMQYEDLVGLDPVHVTTPEDVLSSLPRSKYVEGRRPGDR